MSNRKKRIYQSTGRVAKAAESRKRILASAQLLFQKEGFEGVTIESIANNADVSAPLIYSLFRSKRGILRILMDEAFPPEQHETLVRATYAEKSPKKRLALAAKISRQLYDAERSQMELFQGASVLAPEFKELEKEREKRRYQREEIAVKMLLEDDCLLPDLTETKARDILWAFTGRDLYRMLVIEQKWSSDEYELWLTTLLIKTLIRADSRRDQDQCLDQF